MVGVSNYGIWVAVMGMIALIGLLDISIEQHVLPHLANDNFFYSQTVNNYCNSIIIFKLLLQLIQAIVGSIIIYIYIKNNTYVNSSAILIKEVMSAVIIAYIAQSLFCMQTIIFNILYARDKITQINLLGFFSNLANQLLTILFIKYSFGLLSFSLSALICNVANLFLLTQIIKKKYTHLHLFRFIRPQIHKNTFLYAIHFHFLKIAFLFRNNLPQIAITHYLGPTLGAIYNIANKLPSVLVSFAAKSVSPFLITLSTPSIQQSDKQGIFIDIAKAYAAIAFFSALGFYMFGSNLITFWFRQSLEINASIITSLSISLFIGLFIAPYGLILYSSQEFGRATYNAFIEISTILFCLQFISFHKSIAIILMLFNVGFAFSSLYIYKKACNIININSLLTLRACFFHIIQKNILSFAAVVSYVILVIRYNENNSIIFGVCAIFYMLLFIYSNLSIKYARYLIAKIIKS